MNKQPLSGKRVALVGCGDIGCRLAEQLIAEGAEVHGLRRHIAALPAGIIPHAMDVQDQDTVSVLHDIAFDYVVVTLSPDTMSEGAYVATYINGLRNILSQLDTSRLRKLFWVSSTSVYGQTDGSLVDEESATHPTRYAGRCQLEAEQRVAVLGDKACIVRFSGIYRDGRHQLVEQMRAGQCGGRVQHDYFTNRIHVCDCAGVLAHLIRIDARGERLESLYLATDSKPVRYSELIGWLADEMGIHLDPAVAANAARVGSKRCCNARLLASGYQLIYPSYQEGFRQIIRQLGIRAPAP